MRTSAASLLLNCDWADVWFGFSTELRDVSERQWEGRVCVMSNKWQGESYAQRRKMRPMGVLSGAERRPFDVVACDVTSGTLWPMMLLMIMMVWGLCSDLFLLETYLTRSDQFRKFRESNSGILMSCNCFHFDRTSSRNSYVQG